MSSKAVIVGASGLIGRKLLNVLIQYPGYDEIISLGRKKLQVHAKQLTQVIVDFDHLDDYTSKINGHAIFCCLGSTQKKTPNADDYRKIDHDYPLKLAEIAHTNGIEQYHLISSIGADAGSSNFYSRLKGETEQDIKKVGLPSLQIYQPSVLTGYRQETRIMESIAIVLMKIIDPLLVGKLKKYRSIPAHKVAMAMYKQSLKNNDGIFTYPSDQIKKLA